MRKIALLLLLLPLAGRTQKLNEVDVQQLGAWLTGSYNNQAQVKKDSSSTLETMKLERIWNNRQDGHWMIVHRAGSVPDSASLHQVWHVYLQDDSTIVLQALNIADPTRFITNASGLKLSDLRARQGCEIYLLKKNRSYSGKGNGRECFVEGAGNRYLSQEITVTKNTISWGETGFDAKDQPVFGNPGRATLFTHQSSK